MFAGRLNDLAGAAVDRAELLAQPFAIGRGSDQAAIFFEVARRALQLRRQFALGRRRQLTDGYGESLYLGQQAAVRQLHIGQITRRSRKIGTLGVQTSHSDQEHQGRETFGKTHERIPFSGRTGRATACGLPHPTAAAVRTAKIILTQSQCAKGTGSESSRCLSPSAHWSSGEQLLHDLTSVFGEPLVTAIVAIREFFVWQSEHV